MVSTVDPEVTGALSDCWTLECPLSPLGLVTHFGTRSSTLSLRDDLVAQGLAPQGCTIRPATKKDLS